MLNSPRYSTYGTQYSDQRDGRFFGCCIEKTATS
jgi:hypothetical protein